MCICDTCVCGLLGLRNACVCCIAGEHGRVFGCRQVSGAPGSTGPQTAPFKLPHLRCAYAPPAQVLCLFVLPVLAMSCILLACADQQVLSVFNAFNISPPEWTGRNTVSWSATSGGNPVCVCAGSLDHIYTSHTVNMYVLSCLWQCMHVFCVYVCACMHAHLCVWGCESE